MLSKSFNICRATYRVIIIYVYEWLGLEILIWIYINSILNIPCAKRVNMNFIEFQYQRRCNSTDLFYITYVLLWGCCFLSLIAHCELLIKSNCEWNKPSPILIIVNIISDVNVETGSWYGNSVIVLRSTKQIWRFWHLCVAGTVFI